MRLSQTGPTATGFWRGALALPLLAVWGANDPFFVPAGAEAYQRDVPDAEVVLLDTGHFALVEEVDAIAERVGAFLHRVYR